MSDILNKTRCMQEYEIMSHVHVHKSMIDRILTRHICENILC